MSDGRISATMRVQRGAMGETYDGHYRLDGDLLVVGDQTFRGSKPGWSTAKI